MRYVVLIVDDDDFLAHSLRRNLRREPYEVRTASCANQALVTLATTHVDVVISDQEMPGMKGIEFLKTIRKHYPQIIRFMLTGNATLSMAIDAIDKGAISRFFQKPCSHVDIAVTIRQALRLKVLTQNVLQLLDTTRKQREIISKLQRENLATASVERDGEGNIVVDGIEDFDAFLEKIENELQSLA